jgi:molybdopterin-containing oxidoreductase family iron-sulfur binding subunit
MGREKHPVGVVEKCNLCLDRIEKGLEPACVTNCMTKARYFGDLEDPTSEVSRLIRQRHGFQLRPEAGTDPSIYYLSP